ncbi:hypothetical protein CSUB01_11801 [Colletotrichum sublineola]|uniref:Uncharacterized protein n=1 Tax=Colletotrichum sublineola TaxID=1173701 RepID=A0A066X3E0_COLSU|nr:hypothetical protein CSUB01_11801 [Colletotrichum sublineola]
MPIDPRDSESQMANNDSDDGATPSPEPKKRYRQNPKHDADPTPRGPRASSLLHNHIPDTALIAVETAMFDGPDDPREALDVLVRKIDDFARGEAILSPTHAQKLTMDAGVGTNCRQFKWIKERSFAPILPNSASPLHPDRDELGPSPSISKVKSL